MVLHVSIEVCEALFYCYQTHHPASDIQANPLSEALVPISLSIFRLLIKTDLLHAHTDSLDRSKRNHLIHVHTFAFDVFSKEINLEL